MRRMRRLWHRICCSVSSATWLSSAFTCPLSESTVLRFMPIIRRWVARHCSMHTSTLSSARSCRQCRCSSSRPCHLWRLELSPVLSSADCPRSVTLTHTSWLTAVTCSCHSVKPNQFAWRRSYTWCRRIRPRTARSTFCSRVALTMQWRLCSRCRNLECTRYTAFSSLCTLITECLCCWSCSCTLHS